MACGCQKNKAERQAKLEAQRKRREELKAQRAEAAQKKVSK